MEQLPVDLSQDLLQTMVFQRSCPALPAPVSTVPHHRVLEIAQMHANLVGATGFNGYPHQRHPGPRFFHLPVSHRRAPPAR